MVTPLCDGWVRSVGEVERAANAAGEMNLSRTVYVGAVAVVTAATMVVTSPSQAVAAPNPSAHYPAITITNQVATAVFPGGDLSATVTSTENMTRVSGATVFLPADRGMGTRFGSSKDFPYLSPAVATSGTTTTTINFNRPTTAEELGIALGDIDAESLLLTMSNGTTPLTATEMGEKAPFNHANSSGPVPTVTSPSTNEIRIEDTTCLVSDSTCDTDGASAWFLPTEPVTTITIVSTSKVGFPRYQLWMAYSGAQKVTWTPNQTSFLVQDSPFEPSELATVAFPATDGGPITYSVDPSSTSNCTVNPTTAVITATNAGTCVVTATAAATDDYAPGSITVTFTITTPPPPPAPPKPPTPTEWNPETTTFQVDTFPGVIDLPPPPNPPGGGSYTFTTHGDSTSLCTIDRDTPIITVQQPGTCIVTANIGATKNFSKASVTVEFTITGGPMLAATGAPAWPLWPAVAGLVGVAMLAASRLLPSQKP